MLKLNASFSKKVPGTQQYSSEGFMASVEVEIPDGLNSEQLKDKIHQTFALVQNSVEAELQGNGAKQTVPIQTPVQQAPATLASKEANRADLELPSPKQLKYLNDLLRETRHDASVFLQSRGVRTIYELNKVQCSQLIDLIKQQYSQAA